MNYYYKEQIEYVFYDTLKTDTANIGVPEEIKKNSYNSFKPSTKF